MKDCGLEIESVRREWGRRLLILGHHYQRSSVIRHADERGDSLELSRKVSEHPECERIVFCGVRFMAESADILKREGQTVYMPDMSAGCPMANMIDEVQLGSALAGLEKRHKGWLPVAYVNSSASVKAVCGRMNGSTCTSGNAARVLQWALSKSRRVLFVPDEHLGRNTAREIGLAPSSIAVFDPSLPEGGLGRDGLDGIRLVLWKGFCIVHVGFTVTQIQQVRMRFPGVKVIVHSEVPEPVAAMADAHGSTSTIIRYVQGASPGSTIAVGTELNLVERLAAEHRGRVRILALGSSVCANMARTNEHNLLELLMTWPPRNEVHVPQATATDARRALDTMLAL